MLQWGGCSIRPPGEVTGPGPQGGGVLVSGGNTSQTLGQAPAASRSSGTWGGGKGKWGQGYDFRVGGSGGRFLVTQNLLLSLGEIHQEKIKHPGN